MPLWKIVSEVPVTLTRDICNCLIAQVIELDNCQGHRNLEYQFSNTWTN